jgi:multiple sugar transport system substrate-binding protein
MRTRSLTGITWNHTRGYLPLVAAAQRFADRDPSVEIIWHTRSLQEFADAPIERLAESFDLLVLDERT